MPKAKNAYLELLKDGSIVSQLAENRNIDDLHHSFSYLPKYKKINNHLIEVDIKGKISSVGIFRLVPEGNLLVQIRKRVQIKNGDLDRMPNYIVVAYINDGTNYYIRSTSIESVLNLPKSTTTLFRVDLRELKKTITTKAIRLEGIKSRGKTTNLTISKTFKYLFDDTVQVKVKESDFKIVSNIEYEPLIVNQDDDLNFFEKEDNRKEIGETAEYIVNAEMKDSNSFIFKAIQNFIKKEPININWINENGEKFQPYDFIINNYFYLEVKGSKSQKPFLYSLSEKKWGDKFSKRYILIKLNFVKILEKTYEDVKAYTHEDLQNMDMTPISFVVKEKNNGS